MAKYVYPALFTSEKDGRYSVDFPDLDGCFTCGDDLTDAFDMAQDALTFTLYDFEKKGKTIPKASDIQDVQTDGGFVNYIFADTDGYMTEPVSDDE